MIKYFVWLSAVLLFLSCNSSKGLTSASPPEKVDYQGKRELVDYLRRTPGVEVRGSGSNILVLVRGAKSVSTDNNPLYVVDGVQVGRSYAAAASAANTFMIEYVNVITPPRAGKYGSLGTSGVIEITTKKSN